MLVLPQEVEVTWANSNKYWFINKGYTFTKIKDKFKVNVLDLTTYSNVKIKVICDYCNEIIYKTYGNYTLQNKESEINKDCCKKCSSLKYKESLVNKYGVENASQLNEVKLIKAKKERNSLQDIKMEFEDRGYKLINDTYINNKSPLEYICLNHEYKGTQMISYNSFSKGRGCRYCGNERISESKKGEKHPLWKGGVSSLNHYLRTKILKWKQDSLKFHNFRCVITNTKKDLEVHHLHNFNKMIIEVLDELNYEIYDRFNKYSDEQLQYIENRIIELHYERGFGAPLARNLHREFHRLYGRGDNTPEQFEEFKTNYFKSQTYIK